MWASYSPGRVREYRINIGNYFYFAYPSRTHGKEKAYGTSYTNMLYAHPPSEELKLLIQHQAPIYVIIDKLIEEYPEWEQYINAAYQKSLSAV